MIKIEKMIHGTKLITVWFAEDRVPDEGIVQYKESRKAIDDADEFDTLITDLTESEDEIKSHFSKGCKYKVNRAYREDVTYKIIDSSDISDSMLDIFLDFFEEFWKSKDTSLSDRESLKKEMKAYIKQDALTIAYAQVHGEIAVYHTHIYDDSVARLLHSASLFRLRGDDDGDRNLIGMANRALHFEEMKFFKQKGLRTYDWGGAGKGEDVASITEFKESFGGTHVTYYDSECVVGLRASLVSGISELKSRFR